jgi:hypothetical protein
MAPGQLLLQARTQQADAACSHPDPLLQVRSMCHLSLSSKATLASRMQAQQMTGPTCSSNAADWTPAAASAAATALLPHASSPSSRCCVPAALKPAATCAHTSQRCWSGSLYCADKVHQAGTIVLQNAQTLQSLFNV